MMGGWIHEWTDRYGWMDGWIDEYTNFARIGGYQLGYQWMDR